MIALSLKTAESVAGRAIAAARSRSLNPMSVAVIDASGYLKFAVREDGAGIAGVDIAAGKARAALTFGCSSREIANALAGNPLAGPSVLAILDGRVVLLAGGVVVRNSDGEVIGAVGAAGDAPDNDESVVAAAVATD